MFLNGAELLKNVIDNWEVKCNAESCPNYFSVNIYMLVVVFHQQIFKTCQFWQNLLLFENCRRNAIDIV